MAEGKKRGGKFCIAGGPNNVSCTNTSYTKGISMHIFPKNEELRKKWVQFVKKHRVDEFNPATSSLCSAHFAMDAYERNYSIDLDIDPTNKLRRFLKRDAIPTIDCAIQPKEQGISLREKRIVSKNPSCHRVLKS